MMESVGRPDADSNDSENAELSTEDTDDVPPKPKIQKNSVQCETCLEYTSRTYTVKNRKCRESKIREKLTYLLTGKDHDSEINKCINTLSICVKCIVNIEATEPLIRNIRIRMPAKLPMNPTVQKIANTKLNNRTLPNSVSPHEVMQTEKSVRPMDNPNPPPQREIHHLPMVQDGRMYGYDTGYPAHGQHAAPHVGTMPQAHTGMHNQVPQAPHHAPLMHGQMPNSVPYSYLDMMNIMPIPGANQPNTNCSITQNATTNTTNTTTPIQQNAPPKPKKLRNTPGKLIECKICGEKFPSSDAKYKHKLKAHVGHRFPCNMCTKVFWSRQELQVHIRRHTGEKPYTCDICDRNFVCQTHLRTHRRTHFGEKPYTCDVCKKSFTESQTLHRHKRLHTGEKPYSCDLCEMRFTHSATLWHHKKKHEKEKVCECGVCGESFGGKTELKRHMRVHVTVITDSHGCPDQDSEDEFVEESISK